MRCVIAFWCSPVLNFGKINGKPRDSSLDSWC
jgi:hypothetical protein